MADDPLDDLLDNAESADSALVDDADSVGQRGVGTGVAGSAVAGTMTRRYGSRWLDRDFADLIDLLRTDAEDLDIARQLGRTVSSIQRRIVELVPGELELSRSAAAIWLRERLRAQEPYDWRATLRAYHDAANRPYFDDRDDALLHRAWAARQPLPTVSNLLRIDEFAIARHLLELGLARTLVEVVQRLGVTAGTDLDRRVRLSIERLGTAVHILIVDGLTTGRHVSVHDDAESGHRELDRLLRQHDRDVDHTGDCAGAVLGGLTWTLAERTIAGSNTGATVHDTTPPSSPRAPSAP